MFIRVLLRSKSVHIKSSSCNSAHIAIVSCHQNVAVHSPVLAIAIFHQPIILAVEASVADHKHRVVGAYFFAGTVIEHSLRFPVILKFIGCLDSDAKWSVFHKSELQILLVHPDKAKTIDIDRQFCSIVMILAFWNIAIIPRNVRVVCLKNSTILREESGSQSWPASVASLIESFRVT